MMRILLWAIQLWKIRNLRLLRYITLSIKNNSLNSWSSFILILVAKEVSADIDHSRIFVILLSPVSARCSELRRLLDSYLENTYKISRSPCQTPFVNLFGSNYSQRKKLLGSNGLGSCPHKFLQLHGRGLLLLYLPTLEHTQSLNFSRLTAIAGWPSFCSLPLSFYWDPISRMSFHAVHLELRMLVLLIHVFIV